MAGARALLRAAGVEKADLGRKPIIAVANSYTQFVPGHTHLKPVGEIVADAIIAAGGIPREFNTIAVDDGIAMGHGGMLYSLPSRDLIADSVEYMVNAHCADALICISNCDKITPGMLNAALRLNIPTVATTTWGVKQILLMLSHEREEIKESLAGGDLFRMRLEVPRHLIGKPVRSLNVEGKILVAGVDRGGHGFIPVARQRERAPAMLRP